MLRKVDGEVKLLHHIRPMSEQQELPAQPPAVSTTDNTEETPVGNMEAGSSANALPSVDSTIKNGESSKSTPQAIPLHESLLQRVSTIKEGDNVLLRMPSDMVKAVVASKDGYVC